MHSTGSLLMIGRLHMVFRHTFQNDYSCWQEVCMACFNPERSLHNFIAVELLASTATMLLQAGTKHGLSA